MAKFLYKKHRVLGNKGFSLVELIIVIAIMAVLMAVLAPQLIKYVEKSRVQADDTAASELLNAVKIALNDEAIYSNLVGGETVTWTGSSGNVANTASTTLIVSGSKSLSTYLQDEINSTVGTPGIPKSKTRKAQTYTITIAVVSGVPSATGTWVSPPAVPST